jgi:competence protein ComEC
VGVAVRPPVGFDTALFITTGDHMSCNVSAWGLDIMMALVRFWSNLSWASIWIFTPNLFEIGLFYAFTFFAFFAGRRRWARLGLAAVVILMILDVAFWVHRVKFNRDLEVVFLDVGKGNAALVSFPGGKKMMIDGGGFPITTLTWEKW